MTTPDRYKLVEENPTPLTKTPEEKLQSRREFITNAGTTVSIGLGITTLGSFGTYLFKEAKSIRFEYKNRDELNSKHVLSAQMSEPLYKSVCNSTPPITELTDICHNIAAARKRVAEIEQKKLEMQRDAIPYLGIGSIAQLGNFAINYLTKKYSPNKSEKDLSPNTDLMSRSSLK